MTAKKTKLKENAQCWADLWKVSVKKSDPAADKQQAARWNERADHFGKGGDDERQQKKVDNVLGLLKEAGFSPKGKKVLDIGCGPGALSIPLARKGARVTALDVASGMLDQLKETIAKEDLSITPVEASWYSADIDNLGYRKKFDLVIASMTPAVRDLETFDRMMACSKKYCYYSNFIKRDMGGGRAHMELHKILGESSTAKRPGHGDPDHGPAGHEHGGGPGMVYPFMYLYTLGYLPILKLNHASRHQELPWAEAADKMIEGTEKRRPLSGDIKKKIRAYYKDNSPDGTYRSDSDTYSGMMVWRVDKH